MGFLKAFSNIIFAITLFLLPLFVLIFILRLNNGNSAYFGYEEFFNWIEQQDFKKPYQDFIDFFVPYVEKSASTYLDFANNVVSFDFGNFFESILNVLSSLLQAFGATFKLLATPFIILYFFLRALGLYIAMFVSFINYVITV